MNLTEEQLSVFKILYPWYKEEVFRRREQMMRMTGFACALLLLLLFLVTVVLPDPARSATVTVFLIPGIALFSSLVAFLILQQRARHRMAKSVLIEIERGLRLYESDAYMTGKVLYPAEWQTAWRQDSSVTVYLSVIGALTALLIGAVLV